MAARTRIIAQVVATALTLAMVVTIPAAPALAANPPGDPAATFVPAAGADTSAPLTELAAKARLGMTRPPVSREERGPVPAS
jgi:hypothetical protein